MLTAGDILKLQKVEPALANLVREVSRLHSIGIAEGLRSLEDQKKAIAAGKSWLKDPKNGRHLADSNGLSRAIDFFVRNPDGSANWDTKKYGPVVEDFKRLAKEMGTPIICGGDWSVKDWGHVELHL